MTKLDKLDKHYPVNDRFASNPQGIWQSALATILSVHLKMAKLGERDSEERLIDRLGEIHRSVSPAFYTEELAEAINDVIDWLRSTGRVVNFAKLDPRHWVTERDGIQYRWK